MLITNNKSNVRIILKGLVGNVEVTTSGEVADCSRLNNLSSPLPLQRLLWPLLVCVHVIV